MQVGLYAYRSLCREYFLKENAVELWTKLQDHPNIPDHNKPFLQSSLVGNRLAFIRLKHHKELFESSIRSNSFQDFQYTLFNSKSKIPIHVSGILCPDYDFSGEPLQNLADFNSPLDCLTFFTAPSIDGWSLCFAWHQSSHSSCTALLKSLATMVHAGHSLDAALIRFVFCCSENHAFRISWWDNLSPGQQSTISNAAALMTNPYEPVPSNYLVSGFEDIPAWHFESVRHSLGNA